MKNKVNKKVLNLILVIFLIGAAFSSGLFLGDYKNDNEDNRFNLFKNDKDKYEDEIDTDLFWKVYGIVKNDFVNKDLNKENLQYGMIEGMINSLGDEHTVFMNPEETDNFNNNLNSVYEGIGAYISKKDNYITINSVIENSPAKKAGIKNGDTFLKIEDETTEGMSLDQAAYKLRGEEGTKVKVMVFREDEKEPFEVEITRGKVDIPALIWEKKEDNIALISLSKFEKNTYLELEEVRKEIDSEMPDDYKIILDLRDNTGGYFDQAIKVVSAFVGKDEIAVIEEKGEGSQKKYETSDDKLFKTDKIIILVNQNSASASEILAGALRDLRGIKLIGEKTYGKGSVQAYKDDLGDGSSLKITIAKWLTPNKIHIDGEGLSPDIDISQNYETEADEQLEKALEELKKM